MKRIQPRLTISQRRARAAASMEYMLILALVVIPIGLLLPLFVNMIVTYAGRMATVIKMPFP